MMARLLLITGATGLVGSWLVQEALDRGWTVRALVRKAEDRQSLPASERLQIAVGDITQPHTLAPALEGVTHLVHCAAKVGDWGPYSEYHALNVAALDQLLQQAVRLPGLVRLVHISSLSVYALTDHFNDDESVVSDPRKVDAYGLSKIESEKLIRQARQQHQLSAVTLRPGTIYGPRDRTALPALMKNLAAGRVVYFGDGKQAMNHTFVGNLVHAIFLALDRPDISDLPDPTYNITDDPITDKKGYIGTVARLAGYPEPRRRIPRGLAWSLVYLFETVAKLLRTKNPPLLSKGRYKFLGAHQQYCIDKIKRELGYAPPWKFEPAMKLTVEWFAAQGLIPPRR